MSVTGILNSSVQNNHPTQPYLITNSEFAQLGKDLTAGNLSAAQSDFAILQQSFAQPPSSTSILSSMQDSLASEFQQLSSDLKSGDLTAAQKDYSTIQQDMRNHPPHLHHSHRMRVGQDPVLSVPTGDSIPPILEQANNTAAQQAYLTLAQQLQQFAPGDAAGTTGSNVMSAPVSLIA